MPPLPRFLSPLLFLAALPAEAQQRARPDSAGLVTLLGRDTLAMERWERTPERVTAEVVVRSPRTTLRRYVLDLAPGGAMKRFEERTFDPAAGGALVRTVVVEPAGSVWTRTATESDGTRRIARVDAPSTALPWVDLVHWPFELVLERAARGGPATQPLVAGERVLQYGVARSGADGWTLTHPLRGPSTARVDAEGRLLSLDAAGTTRKVVVTRVPWMDVEETARRWADEDRAGRGVGELSGRGREEETVAGARIVIDYGTPLRRGREIFGGVLPWGQLWRTGANRATHFSTDRALVLGAGSAALEVPPGEYTLFSFPAPEGGLLVVNRQTGQNGTSYDPARDLGRVPMRRSDLAEPVERLTFDVVPGTAGGGTLRLSWDRSAFTVPFTVR